MEINGVDLRDLEPEELAKMIAEGNPLLVRQLAPIQYFPKKKIVLCKP